MPSPFIFGTMPCLLDHGLLNTVASLGKETGSTIITQANIITHKHTHNYLSTFRLIIIFFFRPISLYLSVEAVQNVASLRGEIV